jgi:hypothetical protein
LYRLLVENQLSSANLTVVIIFSAYGLITGFANRGLTLYITATRAQVVWSLRQAQLSLKKTERDHIRGAVLWGVLPGALGGVALIIVKISYPKVYSIIFLSVSIISVVMMTVLASYILWKSQRLDAVTRALQQQVALVALLFFACNMPCLLSSAEGLLSMAEGIFHSIPIVFFGTPITVEIVQSFKAANSAVNIFIYMAVGKQFRNTLFEIFSTKPRGRR